MFGSLLLVDLAIRLVIAFRPLDVIDGRTIPDDAYLSLQIASNIAHGLGPWYTTGHTNGFQPLYVFLAVPAFWLFPNDLIAPIRAALVLLSLVDVATLWLLYRLVASFSSSRATPILAAVAWIANPYVIRTTLNGLETALATFCAMGALTVFWRQHRGGGLPSIAAAARLGAVVGLGALARLDVFLLGPMFAALLIARNRDRVAAATLRIAVLAVAALVVYSPWLLYSYAYTGSLYPVSGRAVRLMNLATLGGATPAWGNWYGPMLRKGIATLWESNWPTLVVVVALGVLVLARRDRVRRIAPAGPLLGAGVSFAVSLLLVYTLYQYGEWYFNRYLFPVAWVSILLLAALFEAVTAGMPRRSGVLAGVVVATLLASFAIHPDARRLTAARGQKNRAGYLSLARWAERAFPPGSIVGARQSGALGYFARGLRVINLDGVVNEECFRAIVERRHLQYIESAGIQWILAWTVDINAIASNTAQWEPDVLVSREKIPDLESWGNDWYVVTVKPRAR